MIAVTTAVSHFFTWWSGELSACVPDRLMRLVRRKPSILVVTPTSEVVEFALHANGRIRRLGQASLSPQLEPRRAVSDLVGGLSSQYSEIFLNVPPANVLRRTVALPLEAAENLREVLAFEMDRHTPFTASEVAYDYRVIATDKIARRITVDLAVLPRAMLEEAAARLASLGLAANRIGIVDDNLVWERSFSFQLYDVSESPPAPQRPLVLALAAIAAGLAVIAWYLPLYFDHRAAAFYETRLEETRAAALRAEGLKKRLTVSMDLDRLVIDRRASQLTVTGLLADLTNRLPDDTWLTQFQLQDGKVTLSGHAPSAAELIALLEASPLLTEVRFASPVTPDPRAGGETFNISASTTQDRGS